MTELINTKYENDINTSLPQMLKELLYLLNLYISQNWFILLLEEMPNSISDINEIHRLLSSKKISIKDTRQLKDIVNSLDQFILNIKKFLLPVLREKLRISGLTPEKQIKSKDERIIKEFIAAVFPDNIERISFISRKIKFYLD